MSIHKSLNLGSKLSRARSVLSRWERITKLREDGRWDDSRSIFGLPKVKCMIIKKAPKKKKTEEEAAAGAAVPAAPAAAKPAAKAKAKGK